MNAECGFVIHQRKYYIYMYDKTNVSHAHLLTIGLSVWQTCPLVGLLVINEWDSKQQMVFLTNILVYIDPNNFNATYGNSHQLELISDARFQTMEFTWLKINKDCVTVGISHGIIYVYPLIVPASFIVMLKL